LGAAAFYPKVEPLGGQLSRKAGWSWGCVSAIDSSGRFGLLTHIAATESGSLCVLMSG
jgi:hypothetical protein